MFWLSRAWRGKPLGAMADIEHNALDEFTERIGALSDVEYDTLNGHVWSCPEIRSAKEMWKRLQERVEDRKRSFLGRLKRTVLHR